MRVALAVALASLAGCVAPRPGASPARTGAVADSGASASGAAGRLAALRVRIDSVDAVLLGAFAARQRLADAVAGVKATTGAPVRDSVREAALVAARVRAGVAAGLSEADVRTLFEALLARSRARQAARLGRN